MVNCHTLKKMTTSQFIVIEYQSLQNVSELCKGISLQIVTVFTMNPTRFGNKIGLPYSGGTTPL